MAWTGPSSVASQQATSNLAGPQRLRSASRALLSLRWLKIHFLPCAQCPSKSGGLVHIGLVFGFSGHLARNLALYMVTTVNLRRLEERVGPQGCEPSWPDLALHLNAWWTSGLQVNAARLWLIGGRMSFCPNGLLLSPVVL